jgi:hypothetical protein
MVALMTLGVPKAAPHVGDVQTRGVVSQAERDARGVVESVGAVAKT